MIVDIIGAGVSGLATAYYLSKSTKNVHIRVWEKDDRPGGLASTFNFEKNFVVEKFYHHIFKGDTALISLIEDLGLSKDLYWQPASTGSYYLDQPYRLSSPVDLLKFKPIPLISRIRMGMMVVIARFIKDWKQLDDITAKEYIIKYAGKKVYEIVWEPLLKGKFGGHADTVSAAWIWSKFVDRGSSRNKQGFELLGYLSGGQGKIYQKIVDELISDGHEVNLNTSISRIEINDNKNVKSIVTNDKRYETDLVVSAAQTPDLVKILPDAAGEYIDQLNKIEFLSNVCLVLTLKKSLSKFYWTNVTDPEAPFVGIIEQTKWVDKKEYNNNNLVYISSYVPQGDKKLKMDPEDLLEYYIPYIKKLFPEFTRAEVNKFTKWTAPYTQCIVNTGYRHIIPKIQSPINNLLVCTMAQIYPNDRQVSNGVEKAIKTATLVKEKLNNHDINCNPNLQ